MARLADLAAAGTTPPAGTRVMLDLRPLQEPVRAPMTAAYLRSLVDGLAADPLPDEELIEVLRVGRADPFGDDAEAGVPESALPVVAALAATTRAACGRSGCPPDVVLLRLAQVRTRRGRVHGPCSIRGGARRPCGPGCRS